MATEAQIRANRQNAQKSTGPKTAAGKARSRQNATKHGLTGEGGGLPEADRQALQARTDAWAASLNPRNEQERWLVERAALASLRLDACAVFEANLRAVRQQRVVAQSEATTRAVVAESVRRLKEEPERAYAELICTAAGCRWLIDRWAALNVYLDDLGYWTEDQLRFALVLTGRDLDSPYPDALTVQMVRKHLAAQPPLDEPWKPGKGNDFDQKTVDALNVLFASFRPSLERTCSPEQLKRLEEHDRQIQSWSADARPFMKAFVQEQVDWLEQRAADLERQPDLAYLEAQVRATFDASAETGAPLRRYENMATRQLHKALAELREIQEQPADAPADPTITPIHGAQNEANSVPDLITKSVSRKEVASNVGAGRVVDQVPADRPAAPSTPAPRPSCALPGAGGRGRRPGPADPANNPLATQPSGLTGLAVVRPAAPGEPAGPGSGVEG